MPEQQRQMWELAKKIVTYWDLGEVTWLLQCTNTINKKDWKHILYVHRSIWKKNVEKDEKDKEFMENVSNS